MENERQTVKEQKETQTTPYSIQQHAVSHQEPEKKTNINTYSAVNTSAAVVTQANVKYKDSVFRMLFKDKAHLLELYNAINDTSYTNAEELEITTLENAVYMSMKNDISCLVDMHLQLYEHQSTYNPNIPLRNLFYVSRQYEKLVIKKNLYSTQIIPLPSPKFIVFYNGIAKQPEKKIMRLSDAYRHKMDKPELELVVTQYNINDGYNEELKRKAPLLMQYMQFVDKIRKYSVDKPFTEAVQLAVEECIAENVLRDFLLQNKAEVCVKNHK